MDDHTLPGVALQASARNILELTLAGKCPSTTWDSTSSLSGAGALLSSVDNMAGEARGAGDIADVGFDAPRFGLFEVSAVIVQKETAIFIHFQQEHEAPRKDSRLDIRIGEITGDRD